MRSGFVAGDAALLEKFRLYRTYHGSAMSLAVQKTSIFKAVLPLIQAPLEAYLPDGGFYLWMRTPIDDCEFRAAPTP